MLDTNVFEFSTTHNSNRKIYLRKFDDNWRFVASELGIVEEKTCIDLSKLANQLAGLTDKSMTEQLNID